MGSLKINKDLKLSYFNSSYYLLHIPPNINLDDITLKIINFKHMIDNNDINFALFFDVILSIDSITPILHHIKSISEKNNLKINFIIQNKHLIGICELLAIPIINISNYQTMNKMTNKTLFISELIRSGAIIKHEHDIIITNTVSHAAEIIAQGNVYIYGTLNGKVFAGNAGDITAKIFVTKFNAELISIAGIYRIFDHHNKSIVGKSVMVSLKEQSLLIDII